MDVKQVLQELIAVPEQPETLASVFLNTWWADEHQRDAVRVFVQEHSRRAIKALANEEARQRLAKTLEPIEGYVSGLLRQRHEGWATGIALFSCAPIGLFRVVATRMPFEPMLFELDRRPHVTPILRTLDAVPPLLVAAVDSEGGRLIEVSCGVVDVEARIERPYHGHHRGGWSQRRFGRHLGEIRERNLKAVAEPFTRMAEAVPESLLVVFGQSFIVRAFEDLLPQRVRDRIVARLPTPPANGGELRLELSREAQISLERAVRERRAQERDAVLAEAARGGLGVTGVEPTLLALTEGRAHRVLVEATYRAQGYACERCGALAQTQKSCGYCGGTVKVVPFPEEIVRRAVAGDAQVVFLPAEVSLPSGMGLAAALRHRASTQPLVRQGGAPTTV